MGTVDEIAKVQKIVSTLRPQSFSTEIKDIDQSLAAIEGKVLHLNSDLKLKNIQIDGLHKEVTEKSTALESNTAEIKELKKLVRKLETEKQTLEAEIKELKGKIKKIRAELDDVKEENRTLQVKELLSATERATQRQDVHDLKKHNSSLQQSHSSLRQSHSSLQQSHSSLQQSHSSLQQSHSSLRQSHSSLRQSHSSLRQSHSSLQQSHSSLQLKLADLESKVCEPVEMIILGKLCRCVQSMIFQKVLDKKYDEFANYKIKDIDTHLVVAFEGERDIKMAKQRWANLKKDLKLEERDVTTLTYAIK